MRCETSPDEPQISQEETVEEETVEITDQTSNSSQNGEQNELQRSSDSDDNSGGVDKKASP